MLRIRVCEHALALGLPGIALADQPVTQNVTEPVTDTFPNPCIPGEVVVVTGYVHAESRITPPDADGTVHIEYHLNSQGVSGTTVTPVTGIKYQVMFQTSDNQNGDVVVPYTGAYTQTQHDIYRLTRQGESIRPDDWYMYLRYHATYNAQGVPTAVVDNIDAQCQ